MIVDVGKPLRPLSDVMVGGRGEMKVVSKQSLLFVKGCQKDWDPHTQLIIINKVGLQNVGEK